MEKTNEKLALVIPTKDRPKEIRRLLLSIQNQSRQSDQIIIVDGGHVPLGKDILADFSDLNIDYVRVYPPSLTKQRNVGIQAIASYITLVGFLDDDIILCNGAIDNMLSFWHDAPENAGGASFNIINTPLPTLIRVKKLFVLDSLKKGELLRSGFSTSLYPVTADRKVQWLSGGNTIWRKELLDKFKFDENLKGYGLMEDLDFSYEVGKYYELFVIANAIVKHFSRSIHMKKAFQLGLTEVTNRYYFLCKHKEFSIFLFYWASLGLIVIGIISSLIHLKFNRLKRTFGNIIGVSYTLVLKEKLPRDYEYSDIKD